MRQRLVVPLGDWPQAFDQPQIRTQLRLREVLAVLPPILFGHRLDALSIVLACQHPRLHRAVGDDTDVMFRAVRKQLLFNIALQHVVWGLERRHRVNRLDSFQLLYAEVRHPTVADLPLLDQLGNRRPRLLDLLLRVGPVNLVQVDHVHIQPTQAVLRLLSHALCREPLVRGVSPFVPYQPAFRGHNHLIPSTGDGLPHDLLRVTKTIGWRRIDPVDPQLQGPIDGLQGPRIILGTPPIVPPTSTDGPRA